MLKNLCDEVFSRLVLFVDDESVLVVAVCPLEKTELTVVDIDRDNEGECEHFDDVESLIFCLLLGDEVGDPAAPGDVNRWELWERWLCWWWCCEDDVEEEGRLSAFLLLLLLLWLLLLLLLLCELLLCTPGGVDSSKSGTIGDGEVIELKFE